MDGLVKAPTNKVGPFISHKFHLTQFHFHYIFHKGCSKAKHEWNHFQEVTKNTYAILSRLFTQAQTAVHCASLSLIPCALISQSDSWHTETDRVWVTKVCSAERNWKEERRTHCVISSDTVQFMFMPRPPSPCMTDCWKEKRAVYLQLHVEAIIFPS